jgi:hypothetical protein
MPDPDPPAPEGLEDDACHDPGDQDHEQPDAGHAQRPAGQVEQRAEAAAIALLASLEHDEHRDAVPGDEHEGAEDVQEHEHSDVRGQVHQHPPPDRCETGLRRSPAFARA